MYKVLIIPGATTSDSGTADLSREIDRIVSLSNDALQVDVIQERTELGIVEHLAMGGNSYDAIHMLGHATNTHFSLSEYEALSADRVRRICTDAGARVVFINACDTGQMGQYIVNNGVAVAICYSTGVIDNDAIVNVIRFYNTLVRSNDPFEDGLKEAYNAADPGDGSLMWLTNGEFVKAIISPIMARLDEVAETQSSSISSFTKSIGTTKNIVQDIDNRLSNQMVRLTANTKHTRYALISLITIVLISTFALGWLISSVRTTAAQSILSMAATATVEEPRLPTMIPPSATWTPNVPPKNTHGATPQRPTRKPTSTRLPGGTIPDVITPTPRPTVTATSVPTPTKTPTMRPTKTSTQMPTATNTAIPSATRTATRRPTPWPTIDVPSLPTATATLTAFDSAVRDAVEATIEARGCGCE